MNTPHHETEDGKAGERTVPFPDRSLAVAQQLQRGLLPAILPQVHPLHIGALSLPADKVGGDFYDFLPRPSGAFDFVLGDVTGHGLTAALVVALAQVIFREGVETDIPFPQLLDQTDSQLHQRLRRRLFVAANYGQVRPGTHQVHLFNAGQQALLFDARSGRCREIETAGSAYPLGIVGRGGYLPHSLTLSQGDLLVCCSDGLVEAFDPADEMFGHQRLKNAIEQASAAPPDALIHQVLQEVFTFAAGRPLEDDLTMLVIKVDAEYRPQVARTTHALVGERRPVALCALQPLDGEQPYSLPAPLGSRVQEAVERHGGLIDRLSADTMIACFGLPELHEDDPERALLALREIESFLRRVGLTFRCGLHLGTVIARADGSLDYRLMGRPLVETLGLLDDAPPGISHLSETVCQHLHGRMHLSASEKMWHEQRIYALSSLAPVRWLPRRYSLRDIYVGRGAALRRLHRAWVRAAQRRGSPTVVSVVGEAGIGKSRLVEEFLRRRGAAGILRGQARPYPPEPAGLFASLLRHWLGIDDGEAEIPVDRLKKRLQSLHDPRLSETVPFLRTLLGSREDLSMGITSQAYQIGLIQAVRRFVESPAHYPGFDPLVLVLEDLHWMDSVSAAILTALVREWEPEKSVLVLAVFRPCTETHSLFTRCRRHTRILVEPLGEEEVEQWLRCALAGAVLPDEILHALLWTGAGHPLFLEELLRHLRQQEWLYAEDGTWKLNRPIAQWTLPGSLQGLILSRVNQLAEAVRQMLRQASVIGQEFSHSLLAAVQGETAGEQRLQEPLDELVEGDFIVPKEEDGVFAFRHALIRQAVYDSLLPDDRTWLHTRVARLLEEHYPGQAARQPQVLAHHYTEAGLRQQAIPYWQRAGQQAVQSSANLEAIGYLTKGLELLASLPATPAKVQQELEFQVALGVPLISTKGYAAPEVAKTYAQARDLCQQVRVRATSDNETEWNHRLPPVLRGLWGVYHLRAEFQAAREMGEQLLALGERERDPAVLLEAHRMIGMTLFGLGELRPAWNHLESGFGLYDPRRHRSHAILYGQDPGVASLSQMAWVLCLLGYPDRALEKARAALVLAREDELPFSLAGALFCAAALRQFRREKNPAREWAEECMALSAEQGFSFFLTQSAILRGWALPAQMQEERIEQLRQGLADYRTTGAECIRPYYLTLLAEAYAEGGQVEEGLSLLVEAQVELARTGERRWAAELHRLRGDLLLSAGKDKRESETCYRMAIGIARRQGARWLELRAAVSLNRLWQQQGRFAEASASLTAIHAWFTEGFDTADLREAGELLTSLSRH